MKGKQEGPISIGSALIPRHGATLDEVLAHADLALYQAKMEGRNQSRLFVAPPNQ